MFVININAQGPQGEKRTQWAHGAEARKAQGAAALVAERRAAASATQMRSNALAVEMRSTTSVADWSGSKGNSGESALLDCMENSGDANIVT